MSYKILLTSTSFQDTPGGHQELLNAQNFEVTNLRGPLKEQVLLPIIADFDGIICGDDEITESVIKAGAEGKLRIISKYGIGLDKIDLNAAKNFNIPVTNCPGVNQVTVAEHVFTFILAFYKNLIQENDFIQKQNWTRLIGHEVYGKTIGVLGLGNIGKEVVKRARAFGLNVVGFDKFIDEDFVKEYDVTVYDRIEDLLPHCDIISFNLALNEHTRGIINKEKLQLLKNGVVIVNTARAGLISLEDILFGLDEKIVGAYLTDVLEEEPMTKDHPLLNYDNVIITPHIGSRTYESVERQGSMAVNNLLMHINN